MEFLWSVQCQSTAIIFSPLSSHIVWSPLVLPGPSSNHWPFPEKNSHVPPYSRRRSSQELPSLKDYRKKRQPQQDKCSNWVCMYQLICSNTGGKRNNKEWNESILGWNLFQWFLVTGQRQWEQSGIQEVLSEYQETLSLFFFKQYTSKHTNT